MITFNTEEEFQEAVLQAIMDKIKIHIECRGDPFVTGVTVALTNRNCDRLIHAYDNVR